MLLSLTIVPACVRLRYHHGAARSASPLHMQKLSNTMAQTYKGCLCALLQYHSATIKEYVPQHGPLMLQGQLVNVSIAIPSFTPTSNPQFDELLADLRH